MRNKRRTDEEWLSLIQECRCSGFSDRTWCEQNNISINTFYNTVARLKRKACEVPATRAARKSAPQEIVSLSFVEEAPVQLPVSDIQCPTDLVSSGEALTILINGNKILINNHASRDVIYHTLSALREL